MPTSPAAALLRDRLLHPANNLTYWGSGNAGSPRWQLRRRQSLQVERHRLRRSHRQDHLALPVHAQRNATTTRPASHLIDTKATARTASCRGTRRNGFNYVLDRLNGQFPRPPNTSKT